MQPQRKLYCNMQKLHENVDTDEFEDRSRNAEEIVIKEHFSPGQLI